MHALPLTVWALVASAKVSTVVVYPDRAQVTRVETVTCNGPTSARFEAIPPAAAPDSLRARAVGAAVEGLVSEERTRETAYGPERAKLEARRDALEREEAVLDDAAERAKDLAKLAQGFTDVAVDRVTRELTGGRPDTRAWAAAFDSAMAVRLRAVAEEQATAAKRRELKQRRDEVEAELNRVEGAASKKERHVEVRLSCPAGTQARVELTYLVGGAKWEPAYEARADEASQTVELTTLATVRQATGEDWAGAKLLLSTALPRQDATPPEVRPLYVFAEEREKERKVLVRRDEQQQHAETGDALDAVAAQGLRAAAQGLSVQLEAQEAVRVPGDGSEVRVRVARTRLKAGFTWRTVPKLHPVVFRVARVTNAAPFPLLPGVVDVYRETGFLGRQSLSRVAQGAPFELTFGVEEGLRVERQVVQELQTDKGLFNDKRRFRYVYRFELANLRPRAEVVELSEHVPVSELDDVKVELEPETTAGHVLQPADGIATWKVKLAPGEKRTLDLAFHVDAPSSYDTGGL
ncbi:mucoidy inhibitor MuiA family protein [Pyxidicoccus xibeiensis]|uniref:mucoidy inhibitor MuiA family protein n=1 Tax=Pyxidicoccus xibeiensis TaxID=2906759 RepID=UPI0020A7F051|nr:mucoidy inhibitor MuiA family protein [Pyxidicoccus xibeiensis]MCP3135812.1 mucoidy inhibitor MuiA family protein [Pyxidicoccus xibeiensis]